MDNGSLQNVYCTVELYTQGALIDIHDDKRV